MKKYIKLAVLVITLFITTINVYATEDLTLSRIYVEPGTLEPEFSETRNYYTLLLNENITDLVVQATPTNENVKYEITGNKDLKIGENIITITVYGENNNTNTNTYTINALKTNEPDKSNALLNTLIIDNYPFNEDFFPEIFNYTTKSTSKEENVDVFAYPQNPNAKVEITGNENLKDSNNTITITVTSENGLATKTYTVNLTNTDLNTISDTNNTDTNISQNNKSDFYTFLTTSSIIIVILLVIIFAFRKKSNK